MKWSAASTIASSASESRRRIGSFAIGASAAGLAPSSDASEKRVRLRSAAIVGVVGEPSFTQPDSSAVSWHSGHTSTNSPAPFGEKRIVRSPISSVRSQIAHTFEVLTRVTLTARG